MWFDCPLEALCWNTDPLLRLLPSLAIRSSRVRQMTLPGGAMQGAGTAGSQQPCLISGMDGLPLLRVWSIKQTRAAAAWRTSGNALVTLHPATRAAWPARNLHSILQNECHVTQEQT